MQTEIERVNEILRKIIDTEPGPPSIFKASKMIAAIQRQKKASLSLWRYPRYFWESQVRTVEL